MCVCLLVSAFTAGLFDMSSLGYIRWGPYYSTCDAWNVSVRDKDKERRARHRRAVNAQAFSLFIHLFYKVRLNLLQLHGRSKGLAWVWYEINGLLNNS